MPKYVLPKGFLKDLELYNLHRACAQRHLGWIVIVESYLSVIRHGSAIPIISPFGRSLSERQVEQIAANFKKAIIVGDGDEPGRAGAATMAGQLAPHLLVRTLDLGDEIKPHHLDSDTFSGLLRKLVR